LNQQRLAAIEIKIVIFVKKDFPLKIIPHSVKLANQETLSKISLVPVDRLAVKGYR
jgi:hypothetical protein